MLNLVVFGLSSAAVRMTVQVASWRMVFRFGTDGRSRDGKMNLHRSRGPKSIR